MLNAEVTGINQMLPFSFKSSQPSRKTQYRFPLLENDFDIALGTVIEMRKCREEQGSLFTWVMSRHMLVQR